MQSGYFATTLGRQCHSLPDPWTVVARNESGPRYLPRFLESEPLVSLECAAQMPEPVLVAVEDDADALRDIERELCDRYARHYRVVCVRSAEEARAHLADLAAAGDEVALVLAGQWLSGSTGRELLDQARHLHPRARRVLLLGWGDWGDPATGEAIFDSIARGRIDGYAVRPSSAPDELFHQAISSMLLEWAEAQQTSPNTIYIVGESWSGRAFELRELLQRCAIPHSFCLADSEDGRAIVSEAGEGAGLPLVAFPDGTVLRNPSNVEIARASGSPVNPERTDFDLVIVGAGPAGLSAAVYGASEGFGTLVVDEGGLGGQATSSSLIRNYLGFPRGVSGRRLAQQAYEQAWVFGAQFVFMQRVTAASARARRSLRHPLGLRPRACACGAAGDGCQLPPTGGPGARGSERRRRLLRRCGFRGARHDRSRRLRPGGRELGRPGCAAPRPLRQAGHARGACRVTRRWNVGLPGSPGGGRAEPAGPTRNRDRRRWGRRVAGAAGAS